MKKKIIARSSNLSRYFYKITFGQGTTPSILAIELTNNCNANCLMCNHKSISRRKMYMEFSLFQQIIIDAKKNGIKTIQLSFYGEPLLFPRLAEAVRFIKDKIKNATIIINTNALLLNKNIAKELLDAGLSLFSISIDGNNKSEFEQIRKGLKWNLVKQNVKTLHELILSHNYSAKIHIRGLNLKQFPLNVDKYYDTWKPYAHKVMIRDEHILCKIKKESIIHQLFPCNKIFSQLIVMVNGEVTICAYDWEGKMAYGKFPKKSIKQLWKTPNLIRKRMLHFFLMKKTIGFCNKCTYRAF